MGLVHDAHSPFAEFFKYFVVENGLANHLCSAQGESQLNLEMSGVESNSPLTMRISSA